MAKYKIKHHPEKCVGCKECMEVCAKQHHNLPNCMIFEVDGRYYYFSCLQCKKPQCMQVCPVGALERENEVVRLNLDLCIGCRNCEEACPFGIPKFNPITGKINKCDMCYERIEKGFMPFCVETCPEKALELLIESVSKEELK